MEHWTLGFVIPKDEIYAPAAMAQQSIAESSRTIFAGQGIVLVTTMLALVGLTYLITRRMTRGLAGLTASTREIRQGNYDARVTVESEDEIGELAAAFNEMAGQLRTSFERIAQQNLELREEIGERQQAEEALRRSEARLRSITTTTPTYIYEIDADGLIRCANRTYEGVTYEQVVGSALTDWFPEPERPRINELVERVFATGQPGSTEYTIPNPQGKRRSYDAQLTPVLVDGQVESAVLTATDVTERAQAEEALRQSEERYSLLIETIPHGVYLVDFGGDILYSNQAGERMLGHTRDEPGQTIFDFMPSATAREATAEFFAHLAEHQPPPVSYQIKAARRDDRALDLAIDWDYTRDETGRATGLVAILTDVTERKRAEEEQERLLAQVQQQARQVQQILDTVPEGVLLLEADERIVQANPLGEKDLVILAQAQVGDVLTRLGDRPLAELLAPPPRGLWHEVTAEERDFQVIARPIETGTAGGGWVMVIRDVTQQREIQRRIHHQERLAAVGQLAAGIAHAFNNIMATIVLYAQLTAREPRLPTRVRERMDTINQQGEHAANLIQQILDFGRWAVLERRPLDLAPLLQEHVTLLKRTLPESIELTLTPEPDEYVTPFSQDAPPFIVRADPTRMQQMVTNLALNARDAMPGGGRLEIHMERLVIGEAQTARGLPPEIVPGEWVQITVSDTGTGIPPDVLPRVFEPFFTTKAPLGSGLGLAQVHGIVAQHDGIIDLESQPGQGTTFIIYLPALRPDQGSPSTPDTSQALSPLPQGHGETILVVEDDPVVRKTLVESLEMLNYRTLQANNGEEALKILASSSPPPAPPAGGEEEEGEIALILSEVIMPGMGGLALLRALREQGSAFRMVMLTGHPFQKELEELRMMGMIDWLSKPPRLEELAEMIARVLGDR